MENLINLLKIIVFIERMRIISVMVYHNTITLKILRPHGEDNLYEVVLWQI